MAKKNAGPSIVEHRAAEVVAPPTPYTVAPFAGASVVYDANGAGITGPINGKAAALFAAAPELRAACERVLRAIEWGVTDDRMSQQEQAELLKAVILKAEGR